MVGGKNKITCRHMETMCEKRGYYGSSWANRSVVISLHEDFSALNEKACRTDGQTLSTGDTEKSTGLIDLARVRSRSDVTNGSLLSPRSYFGLES